MALYELIEEFIMSITKPQKACVYLEAFTTTGAGGEYLDKLLAYKPIFRISQHREPGEEPPHTWMIPSYEIYTGHPIWKETDEHFRVRVKEASTNNKSV